MGQAVSTNVTKEIVNETFTITNNFVAKATTHAKQGNHLIVKNCHHAAFCKLDLKNWAHVDLSALTNATNVAQMKAEVQQAVQQYAQAITQWLSLSSEDANNFATAAVNMALNITSNFITNCSVKFQQENSIECENSSGIIVSDVNFQNTLESVNQCALKGINKSAEYSKIQQSIKQSAKAKQASLFGGLGLIIAIIVAGAFLFLIHTVGNPIWLIVILVIAAIIVVTLILTKTIKL